MYHECLHYIYIHNIYIIFLIYTYHEGLLSFLVSFCKTLGVHQSKNWSRGRCQEKTHPLSQEVHPRLQQFRQPTPEAASGWSLNGKAKELYPLVI